MEYLVDTNIMVDFTGGNAKAADYLDHLGEECLLSTITALELIAGARSQRKANDLDVMISAYEQIPPTADVARRAYYLMKTHAKIRRTANARFDRCNCSQRRAHARD